MTVGNKHEVELATQIILGKAVDMTLKSRSVSQMARAALSLRAGGVGRYTRSKFVHVDSGPIRDWGR